MFIGIIAGVSVPLVMSFVLGLSAGYMLYFTTESITSFIYLLLVGSLLTFIFLTIAILLALRSDEKIKIFGLGIFYWLSLAILYDGLIMMLAINFSDYPIELPALILSALNPIDLGRILITMNSDIAALMGYTGAMYQQYFGSLTGKVLAFTLLLCWGVIPLFFAKRKFEKNDF